MFHCDCEFYHSWRTKMWHSDDPLVGGEVEGITDPGGSLDKKDTVEVGKEMTPLA